MTTTSRRTSSPVDDVHDALVGEAGHDQIGERAQRGVGLERARELLADRRQQAERAAAAPLGVEDAGALECERALLAERHRELALGVVEDVAALEAEAERAERAIVHAQRHRRRRRAAARRFRESAVSRSPSSRKTGLPLSMASPMGVRCESGKRRQPASSSSVNPNVGDHLDGRPVVDRKRDHAAVGSEQLAPFARARRRRRLRR